MLPVGTVLSQWPGCWQHPKPLRKTPHQMQMAAQDLHLGGLLCQEMGTKSAEVPGAPGYFPAFSGCLGHVPLLGQPSDLRYPEGTPENTQPTPKDMQPVLGATSPKTSHLPASCVQALDRWFQHTGSVSKKAFSTLAKCWNRCAWFSVSGMNVHFSVCVLHLYIKGPYN